MQINRIALAVIFLSFSLMLPSLTRANERSEAERLCTNQIARTYGVNGFRHVTAERLGHHKYKVRGQVVTHGIRENFHCKVKRGHVASYAFTGGRRHDHFGSDGDDDDSKLGTALAVGAGLAIVAAVAAAQDDDDGPVRQTVMEDECHDHLVYRMRSEHDRSATMRITEARVDGTDLKGQANVDYDHGESHYHMRFTCKMDRYGHVKDSNYFIF